MNSFTGVKAFGYILFGLHRQDEVVLRWPFRLVKWRIRTIYVYLDRLEFNLQKLFGPFLFNRTITVQLPAKQMPDLPEGVTREVERIFEQVVEKSRYLDRESASWAQSGWPQHPLFTKGMNMSVCA